MKLELTEFSESTKHLYSVLVADEEIEAETIDGLLAQTVSNQVVELFNNKEQLIEQLNERADADGPGEPADAHDHDQ
jgi:arsenate reductase-like glutaredoxin family protein